METRLRSLLKALSWRVIALLVTLFVAYFFLGKWTESISIAIGANAIKTLLYYLHERGWNLVNWGRSKRKASSFYLERRYVEEMIAHAREEAPNECCGILAGASGRVTRLYRMTNTEKSPFRYNADSKELFYIFKEMEEKGWEILGIYHSHTYTFAYPSPTDVELAFWPNSLHFIISLSESSQPVIRGFKITEGEINEVEVVQK